MSRIVFHTILISLGVFLFTVFYLFLERGAFSLGVVNRAFAHTALILIGISFALSSMCYFWNFLDSKIVYRKDIGLSGFAFAMAHGIISFWFLPNRFPFPEYYLASENILSFIFAVSALFIYVIMAAISNRFATHLLGGMLWRYLLRLGYVAYIYTILHFALQEYEKWTNWFAHREALTPPSGLFLFLFGMVVLLLRIALWVALLRKAKGSESTTVE